MPHQRFQRFDLAPKSNQQTSGTIHLGNNCGSTRHNSADSLPTLNLVCINLFPNKPSKSLFKTLWVKEKLLVTSNFSFSHNVFYPFREFRRTFCHFHPILNCRLQTLSVWKSPKFVVLERVKEVAIRTTFRCSLFYASRSLKNPRLSGLHLKDYGLITATLFEGLMDF